MKNPQVLHGGHILVGLYSVCLRDFWHENLIVINIDILKTNDFIIKGIYTFLSLLKSFKKNYNVIFSKIKRARFRALFILL